MDTVTNKSYKLVQYLVVLFLLLWSDFTAISSPLKK